jgi:hypothetical protein
MAPDVRVPYDLGMASANEKMALRFLPLPADVVEEARRTRRDRFGHDLKVHHGQEPCRVCLKISKNPEDFILLSYRPLPDRNPYAEVGPVFIHAHKCAPYDSPNEFPQDFRPRPLVLRAYDADGAIADATVAASGEAERAAIGLFSDTNVEEVHARHTSYTCFDFKIVRG